MQHHVKTYLVAFALNGGNQLMCEVSLRLKISGKKRRRIVSAGAVSIKVVSQKWNRSGGKCRYVRSQSFAVKVSTRHK